MASKEKESRLGTPAPMRTTSYLDRLNLHPTDFIFPDHSASKAATIPLDY